MWKNPKNPKKIRKIQGFFWGFKIRTPYLGVNNPSVLLLGCFIYFIDDSVFDLYNHWILVQWEMRTIPLGNLWFSSSSNKQGLLVECYYSNTDKSTVAVVGFWNCFNSVVNRHIDDYISGREWSYKLLIHSQLSDPTTKNERVNLS